MAFEREPRNRGREGSRALLVLVLLAGISALPAAAAKKGPGYVSSDSFVEVAGDDALQVQVSIPSSLLKLITGADPELKRLAGGLESIEAVILDLSRRGVAERARAAMKETEKRLLRSGWERLVLVREEGSEVRVLLLNNEERIDGLVVMVVDGTEMVFANVAGMIDLAAIEEIGGALGVPGLDDIDFDAGRDDEDEN